MAGGGGVSPPLPDPGESERSAPGGELFPERRVSERSAPGGEVFPERRVSEHPCSRPFNLLKRWISRAFLGKVGARCSRRAWLPAFQSLERVALRAGEGEMLWACGPSDLPFQPLGAPRWLSYLLGPRSGPVDFQGKSTRATSRSASATTTFLRAWHVFEGGLQSLCFREKSFAPPERCARLSAAKGRAVEQRLPAWRMGKEPGTAVRVTQRAKEGRRLKELESRKNVDNGTRC